MDFLSLLHGCCSPSIDIAILIFAYVLPRASKRNKLYVNINMHIVTNLTCY